MSYNLLLSTGHAYLHFGHLGRMNVSTHSLWSPCPDWCWMATCIDPRLLSGISCGISGSLVSKPNVDSLKHCHWGGQEHRKHIHTLVRLLGSLSLVPSTTWQISSATLAIKTVLGLPFALSVFVTYLSEASIKICLNDSKTHWLPPMLMVEEQIQRWKCVAPSHRTKSERDFPRCRDAIVALRFRHLSNFTSHAIGSPKHITVIHVTLFLIGICELRTVFLQQQGCRLEQYDFANPSWSSLLLATELHAHCYWFNIHYWYTYYHVITQIIFKHKQPLLRSDRSDRYYLGRIDLLPVR